MFRLAPVQAVYVFRNHLHHSMVVVFTARCRDHLNPYLMHCY